MICESIPSYDFLCTQRSALQIIFQLAEWLALVLTAQSARAQEIKNHRKLTQSRSRLSGELLQF